MGSYEELEAEFLAKIQKLRKECGHEEVSDWAREYWAPGHSTNFEVRICKRCQIIVSKRTRCQRCGKQVEESETIKGDGRELPIETYFCSQECGENYKESSFKPC